MVRGLREQGRGGGADSRGNERRSPGEGDEPPTDATGTDGGRDGEDGGRSIHAAAALGLEAHEWIEYVLVHDCSRSAV